MKTSVRISEPEIGKKFLEITDLKFKNKVVASIEITKSTARFLVRELAKEIE